MVQGRRSVMTMLSRFRKRNVEIRPMRTSDIGEIRRVGQEAWSDMISRDFGRNIKYPVRPRKIIEAYMWKEPDGCLVAEDEEGIIGAAFSHVWGQVGWVGPIEVQPGYQNKGVGKDILRACEDHIYGRGCTVIGLETMPHILKNLHFYLSCEYVPSRITMICEKPLRVSEKVPVRNGVREVGEGELEALLPRVRSMSRQVNPLLDYSIEFKAVFAKGLGQVFVLEREGKMEGAAILHSFNRSGDCNFSSIKILLVDERVKDPVHDFLSLLRASEERSIELGKRRMYVRFSAQSKRLYNHLMGSGYRLAGSNLRVIKDGDYGEGQEFHISSWAG
ncbi:MAG: GNAT family N-acetyltransferase [Methanomassiliicoccales archaeon]